MPGRTLIVVAALAMAQPAHARENVTSVKPLLVEALQNGRAEGVLVSSATEAFSKQFGTTAPILVDVERISTHKEPGCGRLRVVTRQAGVIERDAQGNARPAADQSFAWQVNYCVSGRFPIGEEGK
ncbi:MAG: hypothetical protein PHR30_15160 [Gallionellaceae bacterium]|nr:hypothetical protein [Gallionellaceae bacterium]